MWTVLTAQLAQITSPVSPMFSPFPTPKYDSLVFRLSTRGKPLDSKPPNSFGLAHSVCWGMFYAQSNTSFLSVLLRLRTSPSSVRAPSEHGRGDSPFRQPPSTYGLRPCLLSRHAWRHGGGFAPPSPSFQLESGTLHCRQAGRLRVPSLASTLCFHSDMTVVTCSGASFLSS